ncbi:unnamed protein product [Moneuplotes crassus]|uniref:FAM13A-like domain-containing protein n=1 Tax=Euplotes crassus TaxID=5936 RepID=A0AAD1URA4_EUPCR|nr:unnamed protein product [Moneuplotes crassus]
MKSGELLNGMLTLTVSSLFKTNRNYEYIMTKYNDNETNIPKTPHKKRTPIDSGIAMKVRKWVDDNGIDFLNKSLQNLGLTLQDIKDFNPKMASNEFLNQEKKKVKDQLKLYDSILSSCKFDNLEQNPEEDYKGSIKAANTADFGSSHSACQYNPTRADKEPLRPLYMYYKKLKQGIIASKTSIRKSSVTVRKQAVLTERKENQALSSNRRSYDGLKRSKNIISDTSSVSSLGKENVHQNVINNNPKETKKDKESSIRKLMKQRESLTKERKSLRMLLDKFEKEFITKNGRKIKYMNDVKPVAKEYSRYKSLKGIIHDLEDKIRSLADL